MGSNRTLAAIVFTDAVGFSALASMNEERALSLIQDDFALMRKIASTHLGQALKTTGDGMLLVFGSALDAIAFSVAFQQRERREGGFEHRIGVHVGDVMLSEQDAQGDGVNVAARIQQSAPAGGIWISASAYDMVKNRTDIPIRSAGNQRFKNLPDAIHCYEVGVGGKFSKSRRPSGPVIVSNATMAGLATIVSGLAIAVAVYAMNRSTPTSVTQYVPVMRDRVELGKQLAKSREPEKRIETSPQSAKPAGQPQVVERIKYVRVPEGPSEKPIAPSPTQPSGSKSIDELEQSRTQFEEALTELEMLPFADQTEVDMLEAKLRKAFAGIPADGENRTKGMNRPQIVPSEIRDFMQVISLEKPRYGFAEIVDAIEKSELPGRAKDGLASKWRLLDSFNRWIEAKLKESSLTDPVMIQDQTDAPVKVWSRDNRIFFNRDGRTLPIRLKMVKPETVSALGTALLLKAPNAEMESALKLFQREYGLANRGSRAVRSKPSSRVDIENPHEDPSRS